MNIEFDVELVLLVKLHVKESWVKSQSNLRNFFKKCTKLFQNQICIIQVDSSHNCIKW